MPANALATQRLLLEVFGEAEALREVAAKLEDQARKASTFYDRTQASGRFSHVKMLWEQAKTLAAHCQVALGRECAAARAIPPEAAIHADEMQQLESMLRVKA